MSLVAFENLIQYLKYTAEQHPFKKSCSNRSVCDLETIPIFHPHYHTHSGNASRPAADFLPTVVCWLVSYGDENEYGNDNGNEIED